MPSSSYIFISAILDFLASFYLLMKAIFSKFLNRDKDRSSQKKEAPKKQKSQKQNQKHSNSSGLAHKSSLVDSEEEEEILNTLIKMADHMRISRINRQLQGEYLTLRHVNHMLVQEAIDVHAVKAFLANKSSEVVEFDKSMPSRRSERPRASSQSRVAIQHYQNYSNGLIFQYYSVRALLWKISLGYLPPCKNKWISLMEGKLIDYHELVQEHIIDLVVKKRKRKEPVERVEAEEKKMASDHPLNLLKESKWKNFFDDRDLWNLIEKDTVRTKPKCKFFQQEYEIEYMETDVLQKYNLKRSDIHLSKAKDKERTYYYDCLTRIIYLYLKKHPEVTYSQGMNELAALVFYSYANKNSEYFRRVAESDAFFSFQFLMSYLLKYAPTGLLNGEKYAHKFQELLRKVDLRLYETLVKLPQCLNSLKITSIKWFNSLFLNQFQIDESLILWDGFISIVPIPEQHQPHISLQHFLIALGLAIVHLNREPLSKGQNPLLLFARIPNSPQSILQKALNLYKIYHQFFQ